MGRPKTGSIDRLPSGRWRARFQGPDGYRHSAIFGSKGDASAWLAIQETDTRRGGWIDPRLSRITVADWAQTWRDTTIHLRPSTRAGYESKLKTHILPGLGDTPVADLDRPAIRRYLAGLAAAGMSAGNVRGVRAVLRLILATAVDARALAANPCMGVKVARAMTVEMQFLTYEQVEDLARAITRPALKTARPWRATALAHHTAGTRPPDSLRRLHRPTCW